MPASCVSSSWYCDVVKGVRGCCKNGKTCGTDNDNAVCTNAGYVPCTGENFCCREYILPCPPLNAGYLSFRPPPALDYQCFRDAAGNPQCRLTTGTSTLTASGDGFASTPRPTSTSAGSINSGVTSMISFDLFSIAPLLGWIGEPAQINRPHYIMIYKCPPEQPTFYEHAFSWISLQRLYP
jgi:hypothetical protein